MKGLIDALPCLRQISRSEFRPSSETGELLVIGQGDYESQIHALFRAKSKPPFVATTLQRAGIAVTRLQSTGALTERTSPFLPENAFLVSLHLRESEAFGWAHNRKLRVDPYRPQAAISVVDLEDEPTVYISKPFDILQFYIRRASLDSLADERGARRINALAWPTGKPDVVAYHLGQAILPALQYPEHACTLFLEHSLLALQSHFAHAYGRLQAVQFVVRGGLAPWQIRRVTEILGVHLDGEVSLSILANECKLSVSHFAHAFRETFGEPPYRWLVTRRVEKAKDLLRSSRSPIKEIALSCGFPDQTSFTRSFKRVVGLSPRAWQRAY